MRKLLSWVGVIALLLGLAAMLAGRERVRGVCEQVGICQPRDMLGAMLAAVQREQKLVVLTARLVQPVTSARETTVGPVVVATTRSTAILPATVSYSLELSQLKAENFTWDAQTQKLIVRRPPVVVGEPAVQWERALHYNDGSFVTMLTDVEARLKQDNAERAPGQFRQQAKAADLMLMADDAADAALHTLLVLPLKAAGFDRAEVEVVRP